MHKRIRTMVLAAGAAAVAVGVGVTSAGASTAVTWTVTPGGNLVGSRVSAYSLPCRARYGLACRGWMVSCGRCRRVARRRRGRAGR